MKIISHLNIQFTGKIPLGLFAAIVIFSSCYYDSEENIYGTTECQTSDVTYSSDILPLIDNNCFVCHSAAANFGGITLEGYDNLKTYVDNGLFLGAVRQDPGFSPMPQSAPKLVECNIKKIETWINGGALNN